MAEFHSQNRRDFLKVFGKSAVGFSLLSALPTELLAASGSAAITILYTNDMHSRIEPFPSNDPKHAGLGGFERRAALIKKIRSENSNVLLLDAGDVFQGTPYFNMFSGEVEYKLMSQMQYDATTIGNHDFDNGIENIQKQFVHANFVMLNANYGVDNTPLKDIVKPYKIFTKNGIKIGVFGLGIELKGLVPKSLTGETTYHDPIMVAEEISKILKKDKKCDYIICLSHLGYKYEDKKIDDVKLAEGTSFIDLIIGGHTHTLLDKPETKKNKNGKITYITQMAWAGLYLGRIDLVFNFNENKLTAQSEAIKVHQI
jgi:5'-nucleotidase